jgi:hypothetical protein
MKKTRGFQRQVKKLAQKRALVSPETLLVGLDLGQKAHAAWVCCPDQSPIEQFMVELFVVEEDDAAPRQGHRHGFVIQFAVTKAPGARREREKGRICPELTEKPVPGRRRHPQ